MSLDLQIINPLKYKGWNQLLAGSPEHSFFYSENWAKVLWDSYHYKPQYFSLIDNDRLAVLLPVMEIKSFLTGKRGVSLPYSDYCNPIVDDDISFPEIVETALQHGRRAGWKSCELRGGQKPFKHQPPFASFYQHLVELDLPEDQLYANFRSSAKRNIKKARKSGVTIRMSQSPDAVKEFYRLNSITKKRLGIPAQPLHFFKNIYKHVIAKDLGTVALATHREEVVASAMFFHFGEKAIYNYGASDKKHQNLRANNLLMWEAIRWYARKGFKSFCFGITDLENDGLRRFKEGMSTSEKTLDYYRYDFRQDAFVENDPTVTHFRRRIFQKMPVSFLKVSGAVLYKHYG